MNRNSQNSLRIPVSGDYSGGVTPDPIPNSEVKPSCADGTAWVTVWESRSLPELFHPKPRHRLRWLGFFFGQVRMPSAARREIHELFSPLRQTPEAVGSVAFALVLVLVYLTAGSKEFYLERITYSHLGIPIDFEAALYQFSCAFCLFFLLPVCLKKFSPIQKLSDYGLGLGNWRLGFSVFVPVGLLVVAIPGAIGAYSMKVFWAEYPLAKSVLDNTGYFIVYEILYGLLYYAAYESFFRGFLQFQLRESLGPTSAILIQTSITTLLHIGKPEAEIASALIAGLLFGSVAFHLRSVWPLVIVHWALGISTDICCAIASGRW